MTQRATTPMLLALLVTTLGFATLIFVQEAASPPLIYGAYYAGTLFVLYLGVRLLLPHSDVLLLPIVTLLTGLGLVMIFRLTYNIEGAENLATTQALWILIGSGTMFFMVLFFRNYHRLFGYKYLFAFAGVFLIASTFTPFGYEVNGARLWLDLGPVSFQPSEFARIALIVFFAGYLAEKRDLLAATSRSFLGVQIPALKYFGPVALVWAASLGLLVFEKDLGSSLLFFAVPLLMLYAATGRTAYVILGGILFTFGSIFTFILFDHVQVRVASWLDPWSDPDGTGFQILQSIFNIADGGLLGTGLGAGYAQTIPEVETDFVFSAIASELGLAGAAAVLLAFLV
ncbi:MAG: FtsW/RodA/SpoVE family cell cycle protein, partial [Rubrobacter sp.]